MPVFGDENRISDTSSQHFCLRGLPLQPAVWQESCLEVFTAPAHLSRAHLCKASQVLHPEDGEDGSKNTMWEFPTECLRASRPHPDTKAGQEDNPLGYMRLQGVFSPPGQK